MSNNGTDMWLDLIIYLRDLEPGTTMTASEVREVMREIEDENA